MHTILLDAAFLVFALATWFLIGYPLTLPLQQRNAAAIFLAPALGLSVFAIIVTVLYRFGLPLHVTIFPTLAIALIGLDLVLRDFPAVWRAASGGFVFFVLVGVALLIALPSWIGTPEFSAFQGNHWDHLNYISYTSAFRLHPYSYFISIDDAEGLRSGYSLFAASQVHARPSVGLTLGSFLGLAGGETMRWSYIYLATLQSLMFFSAFYLFSAEFQAGAWKSSAAAAALTSGFFMQYAFDINAWSQLAAMPIALALIGVLATAMTDLRPPTMVAGVADFSKTLSIYVPPLGILTAGLLYLYPEIFFVYGPACIAVIGGCSLFARSSCGSLRPAVALALASIGALIIALPAWSATVGHLLYQLEIAATHDVNWHGYFQCYLLSADCRAELANFLDSPFRAVIDGYRVLIRFLSGAFGIYFVWPSGGSTLARLMREVLAGFAVLSIGIATCLAATRAFRQPRTGFARTIIFATAGSLLVTIVLGFSGWYWPAGKALALSGPLLFALLCLPMFGSVRVPLFARVTAATVVLAHLGFGLARPIAATAASGIHYEYPRYPSVQNGTFKTNYSWDTRRLEVLRTCKLVQLDIDNPFLDRFVQVFLSDNNLAWFSVRPINTYYAAGRVLGFQLVPGEPDCLVTTETPMRGGFRKVVALGKLAR